MSYTSFQLIILIWLGFREKMTLIVRLYFVSKDDAVIVQVVPDLDIVIMHVPSGCVMLPPL